MVQRYTCISTIVISVIMFGVCTAIFFNDDGAASGKLHFAGTDHTRTKRGTGDMELSRVKRVENPPINDELTNDSESAMRTKLLDKYVV
ncbi:hypothetical protein ACF0H5_014524 [Mactra antiquata]